MICVKGVSAFKSPIDGEVITSSHQLEKHKAKYGVVDSREFTQSYYDTKAKERDEAMSGKDPGRKQAISDSIDQCIAQAGR